MLIKQLSTESFRNLDGNLPPLCDGINILYGQNAVGKTNTLEALFMFAAGKSFRTSKEKELIMRGKHTACCSLLFEKCGIDKRLQLLLLSDGVSVKKRMSVDGEPVTRASEFLGQFRAVLFTPDHLSLIKGGPEERRHLVDLALCQIRPRYVKSLNEYEKILSQRNNYLRKAKYGEIKADFDLLEVLSLQLANAGSVIARQRSLFCQHLCENACQMYAKLTGDREKLFVKYSGFSKVLDMQDEKESAKAMYELYKKNMQNDLSLGRTFYGVHRDELMIYIAHNEKNFDEALEEYGDESVSQKKAMLAARSFGSQGQQRSAVMALKLAEGEIIKQLTQEYPVFLLDDLFSELDNSRRERLMELIRDRQTVITCCDISVLPKSSDVKLICVNNGRYEGVQ